jgi:putative membrane-bound dehydrogenase-like protein
MFIPDAERDDKPDGPPQILLDGFGHQDTHETLNAFIWGPDGWLYGCHGVFTYSKVGKPGTPDDERTPLNAGVWRYHPVRHEFEIFARGTSNPWGVDFNDHGQAFVTACVIPHLFHIIQGARYHRQGGRHYNPYVYDDIKTIADHAHYAGNIRDHAWWGRNEPVAHDTTDKAGGGHAHCGAMIYLGDNWPDQYRNSIFMSNIHGNRVNNDILERKGSGFVGHHGADFLFANDRWFRGINLKYGPDGGVYMIDWYDKNACHRGNAEIWDRTNGRVYKITYGETKPVKVDLSKMTDAELVELQLHRNDWYVRTARRLLQERAASGTLGDSETRFLRSVPAYRSCCS